MLALERFLLVIGVPRRCPDFPVGVRKQLLGMLRMTVHVPMVRLLRGQQILIGLVSGALSVRQIRVTRPEAAILTNRNSPRKQPYSDN